MMHTHLPYIRIMNRIVWDNCSAQLPVLTTNKLNISIFFLLSSPPLFQQNIKWQQFKVNDTKQKSHRLIFVDDFRFILFPAGEKKTPSPFLLPSTSVFPARPPCILISSTPISTTEYIKTRQSKRNRSAIFQQVGGNEWIATRWERHYSAGAWSRPKKNTHTHKPRRHDPSNRGGKEDRPNRSAIEHKQVQTTWKNSRIRFSTHNLARWIAEWKGIDNGTHNASNIISHNKTKWQHKVIRPPVSAIRGALQTIPAQMVHRSSKYHRTSTTQSVIM